MAKYLRCIASPELPLFLIRFWYSSATADLPVALHA